MTTNRLGWALGLLVLAACSRSGGDAGETEPAAPAAEAEQSVEAAGDARLVFSDDFERGTIGDAWRTQSESWEILDGWLAVAGARNEALWLAQPLPERVRIEFDAKSLSDEGDIKFEVFTDGEEHESGYIGIFGGWDNRLNIIARLDEHGDDRLVGAEGRSVEPERTYRFRIERTDHVLRWYIDDALFLAFEDAEPLVGDDHAYFGFNDWDAPLRFDNVRVYELPE